MLRWHPLRSTASTARRSHRMPMLVPLLLAVLALAFVTGPGAVPPAGAAEGQATWAVHVTLAPTWFDPAETSGIITPFMVLYALHEALIKPMPGNPMTPSLAWDRICPVPSASSSAGEAYAGSTTTCSAPNCGGDVPAGETTAPRWTHS